MWRDALSFLIFLFWSWVLVVVTGYVLYAAFYLLVRYRDSDRLARLPFEPWPPFRSPQRTVTPAAPRALEVPHRPRRRPTVVQRPSGPDAASDARSAPSLSLDAVDGPLKGQRISVDREDFEIGAGADSDLAIPADQFLSAQHATLRASEGGWLLLDRDSTNGTFLEGRKLASGQAQALRHGQVLRVGRSEFVVVLEDSPVPSEAGLR